MELKESNMLSLLKIVQDAKALKTSSRLMLYKLMEAEGSGLVMETTLGWILTPAGEQMLKSLQR